MAKKTIVLTKGNDLVIYPAVGAVKPGHLVEVTSAGKVQPHSTEGDYAELLFAREYAFDGKTIDTDYVANDDVSCEIAKRGDVINAWIKAGETVLEGSLLVSDGDGTLVLEASATTVNQIVGVATEALDLSASGAVNTRLAVRVL